MIHTFKNLCTVVVVSKLHKVQINFDSFAFMTAAYFIKLQFALKF